MWPNPQFAVDLVTFTGKILNRKFYFLRSDSGKSYGTAHLMNNSDKVMKKTDV